MDTKKCLTCGNKFSKTKLKLGHINWRNRKYCNRKCASKSLSVQYSGKGNPMYGKKSWSKGKKRWEISGENHWNWKGGYSINKDGYKVIQNNAETNGKKVLEHKKVLEEKIGRKLKENEVTHHINGDKLDNRPENLEVMTRSEHMTHHIEDINGANNKI